jgi:hypothetical protein
MEIRRRLRGSFLSWTYHDDMLLQKLSYSYSVVFSKCSGFNFGWKLVLLSAIWILSGVVDARLDRLYTGIFWCYIGTQDSLERQVFMQ